jgi:hypothetical protein
MTTEQTPIDWATILAVAACLEAGGVVDGDPEVLAEFARDLESGNPVVLVGTGCNKCRANTVLRYETTDDPDGGGTYRTMRITYEHDAWCAYLRERAHRFALRQGGSKRRRK